MKKVLLTLVTFYFLGLTINAEETMYKNPGCMCCDRWVKHMNENGFDLGITPSEKMNELKIALGIPEQVRGCHTTVIDGIIVEGHVPADLVQRILGRDPRGSSVSRSPICQWDLREWRVPTKRSTRWSFLMPKGKYLFMR